MSELNVIPTTKYFEDLENRLHYLEPEDIRQIRQAYHFADEAHRGQLRNNGDPYITHTIAVAQLCTSWQLDKEAIIAALLHDVLEDCQEISQETLTQNFGSTVSRLVEGLTKIDKLHFTTRVESQAENFRKMLLAMAKDMRVILIKLADRTHNMRTLGDLPRSKWGRISRETLDIYVPIAHRLGLHKLYLELQNLAFKYLYPWRYQTFEKALRQAGKRRINLIGTIRQQVTQTFDRARMNMEVLGREKTVFSIYKKMQSKRLSFSQVNDIYGFRMILPTVTDCYTALGIIHQMYRPVPGQVKDYIAIPKANAYQSLHTVVLGPTGLQIEFQFRTDRMNMVAESGVAAHWQYKVSGSQQMATSDASWLQSLLDIQNETRDPAEFWDHIKVGLFTDEVYVFTHKGEIMALPRGATAIDFGYAIHTTVGDQMVMAKINAEIKPLRTKLRNGDTVEVITQTQGQPKRGWLNYAITGRARSRIRHFLRTQSIEASQKLGQKLFRQFLRTEGITEIPANADTKVFWERLLHFSGNKNIDDLMLDIGMGKKVASMIAKRATHLLNEQGFRPDMVLLSEAHFKNKTLQNEVLLDGSEGSRALQYAVCCSPVPGDMVVGYMGHGEGLIVHRTVCTHAQRLKNKDIDRFIPVDWSENITGSFDAKIYVCIHSQQGGLARLATVIAHHKADIARVYMPDEFYPHENNELHLKIKVSDNRHLEKIIRSLNEETIVIEVKRV
jgi:GTP pyrophosphokinase